MASVPPDLINKLIKKSGLSDPQDISVSFDEINDFGNEESVRGLMQSMSDYKKMLNERITFISPQLTKVIPFTRENLYLICAYSGSGKCFAPNTEIMMFDGSIKMVQDVEVGDKVMGPDSTPRTVLNLSSGVDQMYEVVPVKGDSYTVNSKHVLSVKHSTSRKIYKNFNKNDVCNISVTDWIDSSQSFKTAFKGYRVGVEFPDQTVDLDPYYVGMWLGDGTSENTAVTTQEPEVIEFLKNFAEKHQLLMKIYDHGSSALEYRITSGMNGGKPLNTILNLLRKYSLLNNKHIPAQYLHNSRSVRMQVLAGIIDSDGNSGAGSCYDMCFKNKQLAKDVTYLARSLGFAAYMKKVYKKCCNSKTQAIGEYYRISISGDISHIPVKVARKKAQPRRINKDALNVGISVRPVGVGQYFGFEVDKDHLFLLGDFTVTHNSTIAANVSYALWKEQKKTLVISNEESSQDVIMRIACIDQGVSFNDYKKGHMPSSIAIACAAKFAEIAEYVKVMDVNYKNGLTTNVDGVKNMLETVNNQDFSCVMIDYWQLIKKSSVAPMMKSYDVLNDFRVWLGQYIKKANIPIVMFAQLHSIGKRQNKDLDSRIKHCPDIYEPATVVIEAVPDWDNKTTELLIHKDRFGLAGSKIILAFDRGRFVDLDQEALRKIQEAKASELDEQIASGDKP